MNDEKDPTLEANEDMPNVKHNSDDEESFGSNSSPAFNKPATKPSLQKMSIQNIVNKNDDTSLVPSPFSNISNFDNLAQPTSLLSQELNSNQGSLSMAELMQPIVDFYASRTNYDGMPISGKVFVFDIDLPVKEAFHVAAQNDLSFATLFDSKKGELVGMITVTDLMEIMLDFHDRTSVVQTLIDKQDIRKWRGMNLLRLY